MKKHQGFVLLMVFLFLQVFSLLSLYGLEQVKSFLKVNDEAWSRYQRLQQSLQVLTMVEGKFPKQLPACLTSLSSGELSEKDLSWWQQNTCSGNFNEIRYYYAVEALGKDVCGAIQQTKETIADYYRITLLTHDALSQTTMLLQSTVVLPFATTLTCAGKTHFVQLGRQMQRELTRIFHNND